MRDNSKFIEVVMLHRVQTDPGESALYLRTFVTPERLERYLSERSSWSKMTPAGLVSDHDRRHCQTALLVTFDDGYRDILTDALPILERYSAPALVFVTTGFIDGDVAPYESELADRVCHQRRILLASGEVEESSDVPKKTELYHRIRLQLKGSNFTARQTYLDQLRELNDWPAYRQPKNEFLNWDEVRELDRHPLITIGGHTHTHPLLNARPWREAYQEIGRSKERLESELGHAIEYFSYPYGVCSPRTMFLVGRAGYRYAFAAYPKRIQPKARLRRFQIPRIDISKID